MGPDQLQATLLDDLFGRLVLAEMFIQVPSQLVDMGEPQDFNAMFEVVRDIKRKSRAEVQRVASSVFPKAEGVGSGPGKCQNHLTLLHFTIVIVSAQPTLRQWPIFAGHVRGLK